MYETPSTGSGLVLVRPYGADGRTGLCLGAAAVDALSRGEQEIFMSQTSLIFVDENFGEHRVT